MRSLLWVSVLSAALAGCVADAGYNARATVYTPPPPPPPEATVTVSAGGPPPAEYVQPAPEPVYQDDAYVEPQAMVYVNPNVQVIEDYDYPVFFSSGLYWRYDGGVWYSSAWHDRGWAESREVPVYVRSIDRPTAYVHYHADVHAVAGQPGYRNTHPVIPVRPAGPPPPRVIQPSRPVQGGYQPVGHEPVRQPAQPPQQGYQPVGHEPVRQPAQPPQQGYQPVGHEPVRQPAQPPQQGYQPVGHEPVRQPAQPPQQGYQPVGHEPVRQPAQPPQQGYQPIGHEPVRQPAAQPQPAHPQPTPYKAPPPPPPKKKK